MLVIILLSAALTPTLAWWLCVNATRALRVLISVLAGQVIVAPFFGLIAIAESTPIDNDASVAFIVATLIALAISMVVVAVLELSYRATKP